MKSPHAPPRARRGYALLLVLFVLAIAAVATAAVCRASLEKALRANRAEADLRQRWAVLSCRAVLLPRADAILSKSPAAAAELRRDIILSGRPLTLIFADEQAKANVNLLYAQSGLSGAERDVRTLVAASGAPVAVELHPVPGAGKTFGSPDADAEEPRAFETFGQLFGRTPPAALRTARGNLAPIAADLTCWGDGTLNLSRASDGALRAALTGRLAAAEISRLLQFRAKEPDSDPSDLLDRLKLSESRRQALDDQLTDQSSCYSLWLIGDAGGRKWYDLSVSEGDGDVKVFDW